MQTPKTASAQPLPKSVTIARLDHPKTFQGRYTNVTTGTVTTSGTTCQWQLTD